MPEKHGQTARHRRLSAELKRMREEAGLRAVEVAKAMGWNMTKVHRLERGEWKRLKEGDLRALSNLYGVTDPKQQDALVAMAKQASQKGWWARYSDVLGPGAYTSLEATASDLRFYSGMLIPGLLQTRDYAKAVIIGSGVTNLSEVKRRLEARLLRQELLETEKRPGLEAILDEAALRKTVGGRLTMSEQLLHLRLLSDQGKAVIRVLPDSFGAHQAMTGQFAILDFPAVDDQPVTFIDSAHNGLFLEEDDEVKSYIDIYDSLRESALTPAESDERLRVLAQEFSR